MKTPKLPTYGHHKATGQARCYLNGKTVYLGKYGSQESRIRFGEIVSQVISGVQADPFVTKSVEPESGLTIHELVLAFMLHAGRHYVKNGEPTSEIHCLKAATSPLVSLYGFTAVDEFGPLMLKAVRQRFIETGWVRESCNKGINRIRLVFKWGFENELVQPATLQQLQAVAPLLKGRTEARDNPPRTAVDEASLLQSRIRLTTFGDTRRHGAHDDLDKRRLLSQTSHHAITRGVAVC